MPDRNRSKGETDLSHISLELDYEVDFWARQFGVSERELRHAIGAAGSSPRAVALFLRRR